MSEQGIASNKVISPVPNVYRQSISEAANALPPAPNYNQVNTLPTDAEVLGRTTIAKTDPPATTPAVEDPKEEELGEEEVEIPEPTVVPLEINKNEEAEAATKEISGEKKLEEFKLDDENDAEFLRTLYKDSGDDSLEDVGDSKTKSTSSIDIEAKYAPYKEKAAEYEAVLSNPLAKAFIEYVKSGKNDINEFAKDAGFVNVESMTAEQLLEEDCRKSGLTEEQIVEEKEAFEALTPRSKSREIERIKSDMIAKRDEKLKSFTAGSKENQTIRLRSEEVAMAQINDLIPKMENKKYEGLLITPEMANRIKSHVVANAKPITNEKGQVVSFDVKSSIGTAVSELYKNEWKRALVELGKTLGADKTLTARIRPNKKVATTSVIPSQTKSFDDIANEQADRQWAKRGLKPTNKK